jgi:hypothetical protein
VRGGGVGNEAQNNLMESLEGALKSRSEVPQILASLATENVTRSEFESRLAALEEINGRAQVLDPRIAELEAKVDALLEQLGSSAGTKPAKPGKAAK